MKTISICVENQIVGTDTERVLIPRTSTPLFEELITDQNCVFLAKIASDSRVLIVEGISGSGKDLFQTYLKTMLRDRVVYDYSEGEVLHSWKQLQIKGISALRVKFMKLFVDYVKDVVSRDLNAVFLLNRFHLSTYASTIAQEPRLESEYNEIIDVLRMLPVHVFILQLEESEIEKRSLHPERDAAWRMFQQQIVEKISFRERLERQQRLILDAANRQNISHTVIKLRYEQEIKNTRVSRTPGVIRRSALVNVKNE